ncbi:MAG: MFS transporter [Clostridium sp.]
MKTKLDSRQLTFIVILSVALGIRSLGMSIVAPFIANYTISLKFGTIALSGIALGAFSLTQAFFQVPFGKWCDEHGNKRMILIGLFVLIFGLLLSALSSNAYMFIFSRFLQGTGAITAGVYSWISKTVGDEKRADAMGLSSLITSSFSAVALGGGPLLIMLWNVHELYGIATGLVIIVFFAILFLLKDDRDTKKVKLSHEEVAEIAKESRAYLFSKLKNPKFLGFCFIGFLTLFMFMGDFIILPEYADKLVGEVNLWMIFTPSMLIGLVTMKLSVRLIKQSYTKEVSLFAGVLFILGNLIILISHKSLPLLIIASIFSFTAYFVLVNLVPTITNQIANPKFRGSLNGIVNAFTYIGGFIGSAIIGMLWGISPFYAIVLVVILSIVIIILSIIAVPRVKFGH